MKKNTSSPIKVVAACTGVLVCLLGMGSRAAAQVVPGSLIQIIDTSLFPKPSPDPAGITYLGNPPGRFLISDSEVNEMSIYRNKNLFEITPDGNIQNPNDNANTLAFSSEPTGVAYNSANGHVFFSDDNQTEIFEVDAGPDGTFGTADDILVTQIDTLRFGSGDPEGVTLAFGELYIADGVNREVYKLNPGPNGVFDGVDDIVSSFDTNGFGLTDPEGIAYDSDNNALYMVGGPTDFVAHVTLDGTLIRTIDISAANALMPAGLAYAPSSQNPGQMNLYIVDRGVDNGVNPNENDGKVYEFAIPGLPSSGPPDISGFTPPNGPVGTTVTIHGANFIGATEVEFNGTSGEFVVDNDNQITVTVPGGATTGRINVTNSTGTAVSGSDFTVTNAPLVSSFNPNSGPIGTEVTITGINFNGVNPDVEFNGRSAVFFSVDSDTQITATVPEGATTGPIRVTTVEGTGVSATNFSVSSGLTLEEVQTGGTSGSTSVTTGATLTGVVDHLYLASITYKPHKTVVSVSGLGMAWTQVRSQCGGRSQTGMSVWMAQGTPSGNGFVTATLSSAPSNAAIAVVRYSGVNGIGNVESANTNGVDGGCNGGTDSNAYSFQLATTTDNPMVYGAVGIRNRSHDPGAGYSEQVEFAQGSGGNTAGIAVEDQSFGTLSTVTMNGSFSSNVDWAVIAVEIQEGTPNPTPNTAPTITSNPVTTATVNQPYVYDVEATDPDNGDLLTYSLVSAPAGMSIQSETGVIDWTPTALGSPSVTVRVVDNGTPPGADSQSFTISVAGGAVNTPPTITSTPGLSATVGSPYSYQVAGTDTETSPNALSFSLTTAPAGMTMSNGLISWIPAAGQTGPQNVSVQVNDTGTPPLTGSQAFTISVAGVPNGAEFQQDSGSDGIVSLEAEHAHRNIQQGGHSWIVTTSPTGFSGQSAMHSSPNTGKNQNTNYVTNSPRLDFDVNFVRTGTHYIWIRGVGPSGSDDSLHVGLDGQAVTSSDRISSLFGNWTWTNQTMDNVVATVVVGSVGTHTVNVWMREDGTSVDKIVLTTNPNFPTPQGNGPPESLQGPPPPPDPDMTVTPPSHDYGNVVVSGPGATQTFTVRNDGTAELNVNSMTLVGANPNQFTIDSGGGTFTLTPGQSRAIVIRFNPSTTGLKNAMVRIASNDPDESTVDVNLMGTGVDSPPPGLTLEQPVHIGGSTSSATVSTATNVTAVSGHLYLASIAAKSNKSVLGVSGLGLSWTEVKSQCGGRNQTGVSVWKAQGTPSGSGPVTATLSSTPNNAVIAVMRYSGASGTGNVESANTISVDGPCSGGTDGNTYSLQFATTVDGAVVYGAVAKRNRNHNAGAGFAELVELSQGSGGGMAGLAVEDQDIATTSTVTVDGTFSSTVDWAVVAVEILP